MGAMSPIASDSGSGDFVISGGGVTVIACGALAKELLVLCDQMPDKAIELTCLPASWHNHPEKIPGGLRRKIRMAKNAGRQVLVAYGDCGTGGGIDAVLKEENVQRIDGPHCYEMFMGKGLFAAEMDAEVGTFFLTDYMVRHFERIVMQGMGLRKHPQLRDMYFGNYTRLLYIAQIKDDGLYKKAQSAAAELNLRFEYHFTGYGEFAGFMASALSVNAPTASVPTANSL